MCQTGVSLLIYYTAIYIQQLSHLLMSFFLSYRVDTHTHRQNHRQTDRHIRRRTESYLRKSIIYRQQTLQLLNAKRTSYGTFVSEAVCLHHDVKQCSFGVEEQLARCRVAKQTLELGRRQLRKVVGRATVQCITAPHCRRQSFLYTTVYQTKLDSMSTDKLRRRRRVAGAG